MPSTLPQPCAKIATNRFDFHSGFVLIYGFICAEFHNEISGVVEIDLAYAAVLQVEIRQH